MASSGLPPGAFRTTINGRRCTAVPRVAAAITSSRSSASASSVTAVTTAVSSSSTTATTPTDGLAAAPAAGTDGDAAEQSSPSKTDPSLIAATSIATSSGRRVQSPESSSASELPPQPPPAALPSDDTASRLSTAPADVSPPPAPASQSSQVNTSVVASITDTPTSSPESATTTEAASPELAVGPVATPLLSTIESPQTQSDTPAADATGTTSTDVASTAIPNSNNNAVQSTVAVAGGVIGGVVAISILAFFIWWARRRMKRRRRSTLLTPLDVVPPSDRDEKRGGGYEISRGSIGPTPVAVKFKASLGYNFRRIRDHFRNRTAPSLNLDRGPSQFIDPTTTHSRARSGIIGAGRAAKGRLKDWWASLSTTLTRRGDDTREKSEGAPPRRKASSSQPDFLTLLSMDTGELDRETRRRQANIAHRRNSAAPADNFSGGMSLNIGHENPFSDANAIAHTSANPAPLNTADPFSDSNAIRGPPSAMPPTGASVADTHRSRSNSSAYNYRASRDSAGSLRSVATAATANQRNKFRSDPFDLERPEFLGGVSSSSSSSTADAVGFNTLTGSQSQQQQQQQQQQQPNPLPPARARTRTESFTSRYSMYSKYSSGVSELSSAAAEGTIGWGDPGPDVGPGSAERRWVSSGSGGGGGGGGGGDGSSTDMVINGKGGDGAPLPDRNAAGTQDWMERLANERNVAFGREGQPGSDLRLSGGSSGSVGKAM
ncbi:hypothetical protein VTG60DRAFT_4910 [Thermothelomyces hinnuleus]